MVTGAALKKKRKRALPERGLEGEGGVDACTGGLGIKYHVPNVPCPCKVRGPKGARHPRYQ